jgi:ubiquinone/menaquinone biosynthesis C-methylase UbiE
MVSEEIRRRYAQRDVQKFYLRYSPLQASVYLGIQEKERAIIRCINSFGLAPIEDKRVLEIGCGSGSNLLDLIRLGFHPDKIVGNELLEERAAVARHRLSMATKIIVGDAACIEIPDGPFDIVLQSTVFTSILDDSFQCKLADKMWTLTKVGGGVLWYDFAYNNPGNPNVRGVPLRRIKDLFPQAAIHHWRLTLAPPISRIVTRIHPFFYTLCNIAPFLRTHLLCWIHKQA